MPIMDGIEACEQILSYFSSPSQAQFQTDPLPFIYALTSEDDAKVIKQIKSAGFKAIYNILSQPAIQEILINSGLPYKAPSLF